MTAIVYLNGNYHVASDAKISIFDRGLLFADSVYEVISVYKGHPFYLDKHLKRLTNSLKSIKMTPPKLQWETILGELIAQNGGGDMQIYLQITRGNQGKRKHDIPTDIKPTVIAFTIHTPYPTFEEKKLGLHAKIIEDIRWQRCDIKTTALLGNILLHDEAITGGADIAILTRNGFLTEGSAANVFLVDAEGIVRSPPLNNLCLAGITREVTVNLINSLSWPFREENIPKQAIFAAQEVWITSTTKEIFPITRVDNIQIGNGQGGAYWSQINEKFKQLVKSTL